MIPEMSVVWWFETSIFIIVIGIFSIFKNISGNLDASNLIQFLVETSYALEFDEAKVLGYI